MVITSSIYSTTKIQVYPTQTIYTVPKLPWKDDHPSLPTNETISRRRTETVVNRLRQDSQYYRNTGKLSMIRNSVDFIEKVSDDQLNGNTKIHYIPHHPVKKDSTTTPIRVVYDCSCKARRDLPSLKDCLMNTPPRLNDLTGILLKFRQHKYTVCTDIEKAFLNVTLHSDDRDVTRFHWLSNPSYPDSLLQVYLFKSVLFGATCSPLILLAVIAKLLKNHPCTTTDIISKSLYVDNIVTSVSDDNSTTYMAAAEHIQRHFDSPTIQKNLNRQGVKWKFIPKRAPWYGGWWARLIGLTIITLKKVLGRAFVSYESLHTILTEIETELNDRPLTYVGSSPEDPDPLTPAYLLHRDAISRRFSPRDSAIQQRDK